MCRHDEMPAVGPMIYHLRYVAASPVLTIRAMEVEDFNIIPHGDPKPAVLIGGQYVSFYSVANVGLLELMHGEAPGTVTHSERS